MDCLDPEKLRLVPGQSMQATFSPSAEQPPQVGFFLRPAFHFDLSDGDPTIRQRAGLIKFNDVLLVLTMLRVEGQATEMFDLWWNFHSNRESGWFGLMAAQPRLVVHLYGNRGMRRTVEIENGFRKFFSSLPDLLERHQSWTEVEFDRAVRGFCAHSYPKDNLWEMIQLRASLRDSEDKRPIGIEDYPGIIPDQLRPFYDYLPSQGHCIRIIPSTFEDRAADGNPGEFLFPAPVKTVLRCGIRWAKGYPVAPIPFIPGHGLAVPPDDTEF